jgi:cytochrome b involved in lipid metabolism
MVLYKYIKSHRNDSLICQKKKDKTTIYKSLHRKLKIEQHEKLVWTQMLRNGKQFLFHVWYPSCYSWLTYVLTQVNICAYPGEPMCLPRGTYVIAQVLAKGK